MARDRRNDVFELPPDYISAVETARRRAAVLELAKRRIEALRLYEPLPMGNLFHASKARTRLARGSKRSGKTIAAAAEVARAVTGQDPFNKYPKKDGICYCVAKDLKAVAKVLWNKLGRAQTMKMIRDKVTGDWRSWRPWDKEDEAREPEARWMPPLLAPRFIQSASWYSKKDHQPENIRLHNGWELSFFSSLGRPPQGTEVDVVWFSEEIVDRTWYSEMMARLMQRQGRFIWDATPQSGTEQLFELHERAEKQIHDDEPEVAEFVMLLANNGFMPEKAKRYFINSIDDEEYRVAVAGEFALTSTRVFPEWSEEQHVVDWFEIPPTWTRFAAIDPGHQVCGVLFGAMPPPNGKDEKEGDFLYLYDELYLKDCNADMFGEAMANKARTQQFQRFVIDWRMARHTEVGIGKSVHLQYCEALRKYKVASIETGSDFIYGSDDLHGGILAIHGLLRTRPDGTTKLRVLRNACRFFCDEIKRYYYKRENGRPTDKVSNKTGNHLTDSLRYMIGMSPQYVPQKRQKAKQSAAMAAWDKRQKKRKDSGEGSYVRFGPGALAFNK